MIALATLNDVLSRPKAVIPDSIATKLIGGPLDGQMVTVPADMLPDAISTGGETYEQLEVEGDKCIWIVYRHESLSNDEATDMVFRAYGQLKGKD